MSPLLTGAAADRAREIVAAIADALRDPAVHDVDPGLRHPDVSRGSAGPAILFAELAQDGDERDAETALAFLDAALEAAADDPRPSALLFAGTVGTGWALNYLGGRVLDPDPDENDVDALVDRALTAQWPSADLIRGLAGVGVYVVERERPTDAWLARLAEMSTTTDRGITWWVDPDTILPERREMFPTGYYDVGMAHGQAGIMAVLAHVVAGGNEDARPLLEGATEWLLAQRLPEGGQGRYPTIVPADGSAATGGRLAWCYGDAGVACGLLAAGRALHDDRVVKEAADLALDAAARRGHDVLVNDAPLCHGSAGLLQVFRRLYEQLGDERLADAARHWADVAFAQRRVGEPVAGYGSVRPEGDEMHYEPQAGLLEGATGVALALHAAVTDHEPGWDALLMTKPVP